MTPAWFIIALLIGFAWLSSWWFAAVVVTLTLGFVGTGTAHVWMADTALRFAPWTLWGFFNGRYAPWDADAKRKHAAQQAAKAAARRPTQPLLTGPRQ